MGCDFTVCIPSTEVDNWHTLKHTIKLWSPGIRIVYELPQRKITQKESEIRMASDFSVSTQELRSSEAILSKFWNMISKVTNEMWW